MLEFNLTELCIIDWYCREESGREFPPFRRDFAALSHPSLRTLRIDTNYRAHDFFHAFQPIAQHLHYLHLEVDVDDSEDSESLAYFKSSCRSIKQITEELF